MYYVGCGSEHQGVIAIQVIIKHFTQCKYTAFMEGKSTQVENQIGIFAHTCKYTHAKF